MPHRHRTECLAALPRRLCTDLQIDPLQTHLPVIFRQMNGVPGVGRRSTGTNVEEPSGLVGDVCKDWICTECVLSIAPNLPAVKSPKYKMFPTSFRFK